MANDFGTGKSVLVLAIVAGCFAILWPNVFYPMITGNYPQKNDEYSGGCCDVIFDNDVIAIKIMSELCEKILMSENKLDNKSLLLFHQGKLTKEILESCQRSVLEKCALNITELLRKKTALGKDYRQNLDLVRTLNSSICLRESFGISLGQIGLPRRMRVWGVNISKHLKQERPPHLHPDMLHPALREKGRAIPQSQVVVPKVIQEGRPGPIPGMRPPMGGPGHVVPPPKVGGGGTMGIVMPMYTIGIVVFFLYTMLKLMFKKSNEAVQYDEFTPDSDFRREVFGSSGYRLSNTQEKKTDQPTRLGWRERDARDLELEMLKERLQETEKAMERIVAKMMSLPHNSYSSKESSQSEVKEGEKVLNDVDVESVEEKSSEDGANAIKETSTIDEISPEIKLEKNKKSGVKVIGMETTESSESGKWSRPITPRPPTPQNIYLPGVIPDQSQLLVTDSTTETLPQSNNAVVLSGKVTLSLIGFQDAKNQKESEELDLTNVDKNDCIFQTEESCKDERNTSEIFVDSSDTTDLPQFSEMIEVENICIANEGNSDNSGSLNNPVEHLVPLSDYLITTEHLVIENDDTKDDLLMYITPNQDPIPLSSTHDETSTETKTTDILEPFDTDELLEDSDLEIECEILPSEDLNPVISHEINKRLTSGIIEKREEDEAYGGVTKEILLENKVSQNVCVKNMLQGDNTDEETEIKETNRTNEDTEDTKDV